MILEKPPMRRAVRGHEMIPSLEMPNMPAVGTPPRAISPRIRTDMFRRKDSPGTDNVSDIFHSQILFMA
ncbi:unnamed protein product [Gongylonema pulchrum]|uniref:Uncharacterized protein n=1 Tax=Gongylonema pulchrum TaxID=637853 RepID=A0A183EDV5_9BILA|nr:unnamed protein product [Gongylonema pulchrum]